MKSLGFSWFLHRKSLWEGDFWVKITFSAKYLGVRMGGAKYLSIWVTNLCGVWPYASVPYVHAQHAHQELMCTLSIPVLNWCVRWAYESRNWCVHWAYASGTNACTERSSFKTCWADALGTDAYHEHTGQEFMRSLSIDCCFITYRHFIRDLFVSLYPTIGDCHYKELTCILNLYTELLPLLSTVLELSP
jgi:hypothetical protein